MNVYLESQIFAISENFKELSTFVKTTLGFIISKDKGRGYLVRVPGSSSAPLDNSELAELINWLLEEFNSETLPNNFTPITSDEVRESRKNVLMDPLKFRASLLRD